ncbi:hypothetical protein ACRS85_23280 [Pluralibacter gergoviae]|uniref:hypothetical protein n=1 Tax=Pluralibacter gergoviae TaxID=61647 RepID=UPI00330CF097|nr:hypothetical protein [Pluralibacter gergoviae]
MNITELLHQAKYSDILATIALIGTLLGIPLSGYLSYHYAIRGEKRKEWNLIAEPILEYLEYHKDLLSKEKCPDYSLNNFPFKNFESAKRRVRRPEILDSALNDYRSVLQAIRKSPAPMLFFGKNEDSQDEWVNNYPEGIAKVNAIIKLLSLK